MYNKREQLSKGEFPDAVTQNTRVRRTNGQVPSHAIDSSMSLSTSGLDLYFLPDPVGIVLQRIAAQFLDLPIHLPIALTAIARDLVRKMPTSR